ncbi:MAG: phage major capsid protein [Candidatus Fimadaptatus sp.]
MDTISQLREDLRNMQARYGELRTQARTLANDPSATVEQAQTLRDSINALRARIDILRDDIAAQEAEGGRSAGVQPSQEPRGLRDMLASREYARAFVSALRQGLTPGRPATEGTRVLYDALTIAGGSPEGSDGGFLVPADMDAAIREQLRASAALSELTGIEYVSSNTGWRVTDTAPAKGFTKLSAELSQVPADDQPAFRQVPFSLETYGLCLPVSNELLADEVAGLMTYLSRWFARKLAITHNQLILAAMAALEATTVTVTGGALDVAALKSAFYKLDPAIQAGSVVIASTAAFAALDEAVDDKGRPLLQPDLTQPSVMTLMGCRVHLVSDALLTTPTLYIGMPGQYMTLFARQGLEIASTSVGGNAWRTNSTELRGIARLDTGVFDPDALVRVSVSKS